MLAITSYTSELRSKVADEVRHQKACHIYELERNPNSEISKAIDGMNSSVLATAIILSGTMLARGDYLATFATIIATCGAQFALTYRESSVKPSLAANWVYNSDIIKEKMLAAYQVLPQNMWPRTLNIFSRGANIAHIITHKY